MKSPRTQLVVAAVTAMLVLAACGGTGATSEVAEQTTTTLSAAADFSDLGALPDEKVQPADVDWGGLDLTDQRLFTLISEIDETFRTRAAEVWSNDYRLDQTPLAFAYRDSSGEITKMYVFHHPNAASLPGAEKVELDDSLGLDDVYRIDPPDNIAKLPASQPFDFDADVGGTSSMLFFLDEGDPFLSPSTWDFARFVVHETFHRYQLVDARWDEDFPDRKDYPRDAENAALATLEDRVLAAMVEAGDSDEIQRRLDQFLAIRQARNEALDLGNLEPAQELGEGAARYVENRYAELHGRPGRWVTEGPEQAALTLDWLEFGRFYDTGAQLGWALDQLGIAWKDAATNGTSPVDVARAVSEPSNPTALIEEAKSEFDYDQLLVKAVAADLENADSTAPGAAMDDDLVQCLADNGLLIDTTLEALNPIDLSDPAVAAALDSCGIGLSGNSTPPKGGTVIDEDEILACLADSGTEVGPDGLASIDPTDADVQDALSACGLEVGTP
ncbi:MAG: hypothetical protein KJN63_07525 [Acidimicrobiia bacterium]|nr:hypothetical protein [Acidimicrobiia bacterium]